MRSSRVTPNTVGTPTEWNELREDARGASRLLAHQMYGTLALPTNPTNSKTLTLDINGTNITITFVTSIGSTAGNVLIGSSAAATAANLLQLLQNPTISNSTQVAIGTNTSANVTLINYIAWSLITGGTSIIASSNAFSLYTPDTSFSATTTVTGGSYTANTMALFVEPGVVYVNGTEIYFNGGVSPTVTAPTGGNNRIDVLSMSNTGTLAWTTGSPASSPSTPTYPANQIPICEIYNVSGETALYDSSNQQSGQGYIYNDVRPFLAYPIPIGAIPDNVLPATDATYSLGNSMFRWANGNFSNSVTVNGASVALAKFGGTGTSGALAISSGTTTINVGGAAYYELNYTTLSITGTAQLVFSNPHANGTLVVIKVQGALTLTSSATPNINVSSMGAAGGAASGGGTASGHAGNAGNSFYLFSTNPGTGATSSGSGTAGSATPALSPVIPTALTPLKYGNLLSVGAGGGSGSSSNSSNSGSGGGGGTGGGALLIECGGALNFTGSIYANGANGANGNATYGGGGGGGGAGIVLIAYALLTANTGTITASAGSAGTNGGGSGTTGGAGASACGTGSLVVQNNDYS